MASADRLSPPRDYTLGRPEAGTALDPGAGTDIVEQHFGGTRFARAQRAQLLDLGSVTRHAGLEIGQAPFARAVLEQSA